MVERGKQMLESVRTWCRWVTVCRTVCRTVCPAARASLLACVAIAAPLDGQVTPESTITGLVIEAATSRPIDLARVHLLGTPIAEPAGVARDEPVTRSGWTDVKGRYTFSALPAGAYRITVSRLGYQASTLWVAVPAPSSLSRSVALEVDPVRLEPVHVATLVAGPGWSSLDGGVTAGPASNTGADLTGARTGWLDVHELSEEAVREFATLGEPDILRALQRLPGVSSRGDFSADLWTRGAPWGMTRILLDGLPLYDPLHMGGTTSGLPADGLASALLLPGVRPAPLSQGAAGTVSLITRRAGSVPVRKAAVSPLALRTHLEDRWLRDHIGLSLTARRSWWDWIDPPALFTGEGSNGRVDYHFMDVKARVDARLPASVTLEAGGLLEEDRLDGHVQDLVGDSKGRWGNRLGWVALGRSWGDGLDLRALVGGTKHASRTRSKPWRTFYAPSGVPALDWMDLEIGHTLIRAEAEGRAADGALGWALGWDVVRERLTQNGIEAADRRAPGVAAPASLAWNRGWVQTHLRRRLAHLSAGLAWDFPEQGATRGMGPLPNARIRVNPDGRLVLEAAWGRSVQTAYPFTRAGRSVGPALGVGHVWILAGGEIPALSADARTLTAEARLPHGLGIGATIWRRRVAGMALNDVVTIREGEIVTPGEEDHWGRESGQGTEISVWRRAGRVTGSASYSQGRSEMTGPEGDTWTSPGERRHSVNLQVTGRMGEGLRGSAFFTWESGWPYALGPWSCEDPDPCELELGHPLRPTSHSFLRSANYRSLDLMLDWERHGERAGWGASIALRNALGWNNVSAYRPGGCSGRALISVVCRELVGLGRFSPGLVRPTPAISLRVLF